MKKLVSLGVVFTCVAVLAACQPKEDPKELTTLAFDNALQSNGFNVKSEGKVSFDLSKVKAEDKEQEEINKAFKGISFTTNGALDFKNKKFEQEIATKVPFKDATLGFHFAVNLDEKKNKVTVDNDNLVESLKSYWTFTKSIANKELGKENIKVIDNIVAFFDKKFENTYTTVDVKDYLSKSPTKELKKSYKTVQKVLSWIPAEKYDYAKDKQGQYGHVVIALNDSETKDVLEKGIEEQTKGNSSDDKVLRSSALESFKEFKKMVTFETVNFDLLVNKEKQPVSLSLHVKMKVKEDTSNQLVPVEIKTTTTFANFNSPSFVIPKKEKKVMSFEEVQKIVNDKVNEFQSQASDLED